MGGWGRRRFRRWMIAWTGTTWRPYKTHRLYMSLIKSQSNCCRSSREFLWLLGERKTRAPSLSSCRSYVTMVRQDWEFSNGVNRNTRSRWCWRKHTLSAYIVNASQIQSNPVCATRLLSNFTAPGSAMHCVSDEKRLHTITGKGMLDVKTYWLFCHDYHLHSVGNPYNETDACLCWSVTPWLWKTDEPAWESDRSLSALKWNGKFLALLWGSVKLFAH